jgi:hypothetical protein
MLHEDKCTASLSNSFTLWERAPCINLTRGWVDRRAGNDPMQWRTSLGFKAWSKQYRTPIYALKPRCQWSGERDLPIPVLVTRKGLTCFKRDVCYSEELDSQLTVHQMLVSHVS